jgi:4-amino-4-deoxy-L-arabinose transferase-like glycosyltransferase
MQQFLSTKRRTLLLTILAFTLLVRLFTLGAYPLADMTEARYAEIARKMDETNNWVTPQEDYGVPFWAKPPLSTWLTAICFRMFGVSEFTARLSPFLLMLAMCWLTYYLTLRQRDWDQALMSVVIAATAGITFVIAGAVMTDAALGLSTTICMVAFWQAHTTRSRFWGYAFFVGLAAGLLTKGLVPFVLTLFPIALWTVWKRQWQEVWDRLPWLTGTFLTIVLAVPWYLAAEIRTPGFLNYFFIGEHLGKFMDSGWKGDLYGVAHSYPRGTIWLAWLVSNLPWSLVFLAALIKKAWRKKPGEAVLSTDVWSSYLISWAISPMIFFTLAGNIMWTYVLTGVPAFAVLVAEVWRAKIREKEGSPADTRDRGILWPIMALAVPLICIIGMSTIGPELVSQQSQKAIVRQYESLRTDNASKLVYLYKRFHSADFYSRGKAELATTSEQIDRYFQNGSQDFFVLYSWNIEGLSPAVREKLEPVWNYGDMVLMRERSSQP